MFHVFHGFQDDAAVSHPQRNCSQFGVPLRNSCGGSHGSDVEAELASPALEVTESAFFEELFVGFLSALDIGLAELEHAIEQACELVGPGVGGHRCSKMRFDAPDEGADGTWPGGGPTGCWNS